MCDWVAQLIMMLIICVYVCFMCKQPVWECLFQPVGVFQFGCIPTCTCLSMCLYIYVCLSMGVHVSRCSLSTPSRFAAVDGDELYVSLYIHEQFSSLCDCVESLRLVTFCGSPVLVNWKVQVSAVWVNGQHQPLWSHPLHPSQGASLEIQHSHVDKPCRRAPPLTAWWRSALFHSNMAESSDCTKADLVCWDQIYFILPSHDNFHHSINALGWVHHLSASSVCTFRLLFLCMTFLEQTYTLFLNYLMFFK